MSRKQFTPRTDVVTVGSFVAIPSAFEFTDSRLRNAIKLEFRTVFADQRPESLNLGTVFASDRFLIDLAAVIPAAIDPQKIARDCDLVKRIAMEHPDQFTKLIEAFCGGSPDISKGFGLATELGLTEEASVKVGGGLIGLLIVVAVALFAGGCAHVKPYIKPTADGGSNGDDGDDGNDK